MSNYIMKIYKTRDTEQLPDVLEHCEAPVYMMTDDGKEVALKKNEDVMALFGYYWKTDSCQEVKLKFTDSSDAQRALNCSFGL